MNQDKFSSFADSPMAPARRCFAIEPHDIEALPEITKAIYIGTGGTVVLATVDGGADVTFHNLPDAYVLDVRAHCIRATGTTASDIVGLA